MSREDPYMWYRTSTTLQLTYLLFNRLSVLYLVENIGDSIRMETEWSTEHQKEPREQLSPI
jgi:hypothetical protein